MKTIENNVTPMTATPYHFNYIGSLNGLHEACLMDEWGVCVASFKADGREAAEANCKFAMHAANEHAALCAVAEAAEALNQVAIDYTAKEIRGPALTLRQKLESLASIRGGAR